MNRDDFRKIHSEEELVELLKKPDLFREDDDLVIENIFYADCGNSVLQVNKNVTAKLFFESQCSVDVRGELNSQFGERVSKEGIKSLGIAVLAEQSEDEANRAYFEG